MAIFHECTLYFHKPKASENITISHYAECSRLYLISLLALALHS